MADTVEGLVPALLALAKANIPTDVQELLIAGDPMRGVPPGALASALEALVVERDEARVTCRTLRGHLESATASGDQARRDHLAAEAQRDKLREGLEYAAMGLGRIHDSLLSNGPKQASGEMTAHFRDRARSTLNEIAP